MQNQDSTFVTPVHDLEDIDGQAFRENCDYIRPQQLINGLYLLHEELYGLTYEVFSELTSDQREALTDCLQAMRREFCFGTLTHLRAHTNDCENYQRKALEFCAFGVQIFREPHAATTWLEGIKSKTKYEKYKKKFKVMTLLSDLEPLGIKLADLYSSLCQQVHASAYSIKTQTRIIKRRAVRINHLLYHDDSSSLERYELAQRFVTTITMDHFMLIVFAKALENRFHPPSSDAWNLKSNDYAALLSRETDRIKLLPKND